MAGICLYLLLNQKRDIGSIIENWKVFLFYILLANIPDMDFLLGLIQYGQANIIHGKITHSILFAVTASITIAVLYGLKHKEPFFRNFIVYGVLILSHDLIDIFSAKAIGFNRGEGVALFYPFIEYKISSPFSLFYGIRHKDLIQLLSIRNLYTILFEVLVFIPTIAIIYFLKSRKSNSESLMSRV